MQYSAINIQGNIISSEILEKIRIEDIKHQSQAEFGLDRNTSIRDEIGIAWAATRAHWSAFQLRRERLKDSDSGTSETRQSWMNPFLRELGYDLEKSSTEIINGKTYAISHRAVNRDGFPVHIVGINQSLDKRPEVGGTRLSPHALLQEYLNNNEHLYALITNGRFIRLLRDATRLSRLSYLEFDLERIMEEELFSEFALLYRVLHATRMPEKRDSGEEAFIEYYHLEALSSGSRIREKLSEAVEKSLKLLANGLLKHPSNTELQNLALEGKLKPETFYLHLLRLVYRVLFLMVLEERQLIYPDKRDEETNKKKNIYYKYYSIGRLTKLAEKLIYVDPRKTDIWKSLIATFRLFEDGKFSEKLGIKPLGSGLFDSGALGNISFQNLDNGTILKVLQLLVTFENENKQRVHVNYADLDVEEFGSVYEGLLEYDAAITEINGQATFAFVKGDNRASSGSHYTPEELVKPLIKHSLDYIIEERINNPKRYLSEEEILKASPSGGGLEGAALLSITVCDVACGSGHILLSAARRIATELASVREGAEQPSPAYYRAALRDVIKNCIYGVDLNPLAVELCKVALWLESHNPGEPLGFLDHHIKCGNSIVGLAHIDELQNGIADEAFKTLPGDDKDTAKYFRDKNRKEFEQLKGQHKLDFETEIADKVEELAVSYGEVNHMQEQTPAEVEAKAQAYEKLMSGSGWLRLKQLADMQVAQFFIPKTSENENHLITDGDYRNWLNSKTQILGQAPAYASRVGAENHFFHWFLEFPTMIQHGGFDCVLGNPPYLGGSKISGHFSVEYLNTVQSLFNPVGGVSDLITYFLRRDHSICRSNGFVSLITTNSIIDGNTREFGLEFLTRGSKSNIVYANKSIKWPGVAKIVVSLFSLIKGSWPKKRFLDNKVVLYISPFFSEDEDLSAPISLYSNQDICFKGSSFLGEGFLISPSERDFLIKDNAKNEFVINELINDQDINEKCDLSHSRIIINFYDWPESKAANCTLPFKIIEEKVKPERLKSTQKPLRDKWWLYERSRMNLYNSIGKNVRCFVAARTTKFWNVIPFKTKSIVFSDSTVVFDKDKFAFLTLIQNSLHEIWVQKYSSSLATTLIYTVNAVFETFPFPQNLSEELEQKLESIGVTYHEHRRQLMLKMQLGLTKTYNAFHAKEIHSRISSDELKDKTPKEIQKQYGKEVWNLWNHLQKTENACSWEEAVAGIVELRRLHVEMDNAVLEAYGWHTPSPSGRAGVGLFHDFYEVDYLPENDRVRFTISPTARKEVLKRLLLLNHERYEEELNQGLHKKEDAEKFYHEKGQPMPAEVAKYYTKKYEKPKAKPSKLEEPKGEYGQGMLF